MPTYTYKTPDNQFVDVADNEVDDALKSGLKPVTEMIHSKTRESTYVDASEMPEAHKSGFVLPHEIAKESTGDWNQDISNKIEDLVRSHPPEKQNEIRQSLTTAATMWGGSPEQSKLASAAGTGQAMVDEALLNAPSFIHKKLQDETVQKDIDTLRNTVSNVKPALQKGLESGAGIAAGLVPTTGVLKASKGASVLADIGKATLTGAGQGALQGLTTSDTGKEIEGVEIGAALGAGGGALVGGGAKVLGAAKGLIDPTQARLAVLEPGIAARKAIVKETGRSIEDAVKESPEVFQKANSIKDVYHNAEKEADRLHNETKNLFQRVKDSATPYENHAVSQSFKESFTEVKDKAFKDIEEKLRTEEIEPKEAERLKKSVEELLSRNEVYTNPDKLNAGEMLQHFHEVKQGLYKKVGAKVYAPGSVVDPSDAITKNIAKDLLAAVEKAANTIDPNVGGSLTHTLRKQSNAIQIRDSALNAAARNQKIAIKSVSDFGTSKPFMTDWMRLQRAKIGEKVGMGTPSKTFTPVDFIKEVEPERLALPEGRGEAQLPIELGKNVDEVNLATQPQFDSDPIEAIIRKQYADNPEVGEMLIQRMKAKK